MRFKNMLAALLLGVAAQGHAAIVYQNDFNAENGGVASANYAGFTGIHVISGSVDLVNASTGISCPSGSCVNLAGTAGVTNAIATDVFHYLAGDTVSLEFLIGGDQTNSSEPYGVSAQFLGGGGTVSLIGGVTDGSFENPPAYTPLGSFAAGGTVASSASATLKKLYFVAAADGDAYFTLSTYPTLSVADPFSPPTFSDDNSGPILDNLVVRIDSAAAVPEPGTWAMMLAGLGAVGLSLRRCAFASA